MEVKINLLLVQILLVPYKKEKKMDCIKKPWGHYKVVFQEDGVLVKIITVFPGEELSDQCHNYRTEIWTVKKGEADLIIEKEKSKKKEEVYLSPGVVVVIEKKTWHWLKNPYKDPFVFLEMQIGNCYEEDIVRRYDKYKRL